MEILSSKMDSAGTTTLPAPSNYPLNGRLAKPSEEISNSVSPASMSGKVNLGKFKWIRRLSFVQCLDHCKNFKGNERLMMVHSCISLIMEKARLHKKHGKFPKICSTAVILREVFKARPSIGGQVSVMTAKCSNISPKNSEHF